MMSLFKPAIFLAILLFTVQSGFVFPKEHSTHLINKGSTEEGFLRVISRIERAILTLNPKLNKKYAKKLSIIVAINSRKYNLDPRLLISIMNTESSFNQKAVSSTNDISIAQINLAVWTPSFFKKKTGKDLDVKKLKEDEAYAISRMCLILLFYKNEFPTDKTWYARYHSGTPKYKRLYLHKLYKNAKKIEPIGKNLLAGMPTLSEIKYAYSAEREVATFLK